MKKWQIFLDLGDTLIYRVKSHFQFDEELIYEIASTCPIKSNELKAGRDWESLYKSMRFSCLKEEEDYERLLFSRIFEELGIYSKFKEFIKKRKEQKRYLLFPGAVNFLNSIANKNNLKLSILTEGRPSRRRVINQLGLNKYFDSDNIYISDELGFRKNTPSTIRDLVKLPNVILVDDIEDNIKSSKLVGWNGVLFSGHNDSFNELEKKICAITKK